MLSHQCSFSPYLILISQTGYHLFHILATIKIHHKSFPYKPNDIQYTRVDISTWTWSYKGMEKTQQFHYLNTFTSDLKCKKTCNVSHTIVIYVKLFFVNVFFCGFFRLLFMGTLIYEICTWHLENLTIFMFRGSDF